MKRFFAVVTIILMMAAVCSAQGKKHEQSEKKTTRWEQIKAEKVGFITQRLNLSVEEAQLFWPVYNQYQKACATAGKNLRHAMKALKPKSKECTVSDKEYEELISAYLKAKKEFDSILESFNKEFLKVLPPAKVANLYMAEEDFKKVVFNKVTCNNPERPKNAPAEGQVQQKTKPTLECDINSAAPESF